MLKKMEDEEGEEIQTLGGIFPEEEEEELNDFNKNWNFVGDISGRNTFLYRNKPLPVNPHHEVKFSDINLSQFVMKKDNNVFSCGSRQGYSSVCGSHYVEEGTYFFEVLIIQSNEPGRPTHVRIGFSDYRFNKNKPVGADKYSYGYRDSQGDVFHNGMEVGGKKYGESYKTGDMIGCLIHLPKRKNKIRVQQERTEDIGDDGKSIIFIRNRFLPEFIDNSYIAFYKNGRFQGRAFSGMERTRYYPTVSLFRGATVRINVGPNFSYYPQDISQNSFRPYCSVFSGGKREPSRSERVEEMFPHILDHTIDLETNFIEKQSPRKKNWMIRKSKSAMSPRGRKKKKRNVI